MSESEVHFILKGEPGRDLDGYDFGTDEQRARRWIADQSVRLYRLRSVPGEIRKHACNCAHCEVRGQREWQPAGKGGYVEL